MADVTTLALRAPPRRLDTFRVQKGMTLYSTRPDRDSWPAGKSYDVVVDHCYRVVDSWPVEGVWKVAWAGHSGYWTWTFIKIPEPTE